MPKIDVTALHEVDYATLDRIATVAGALVCANCEENLWNHAGTRCLFDGTSTFDAFTLNGYVDKWGNFYTFDECVKIMEEVDRQDQERWQTDE